MKKISGVILVMYLLFSCSSNKKMEQNEIIGEYKCHNPNKIELIFSSIFTNRHYSKQSLSLKKDSSFVHNTCANIIKGNWKVANDSLLLFVKSNRFRIDSLNYSKKYSKDTICSKTPEVWFIKGNKLREDMVRVKDNKKVYYILEKQ